MKILFISDVVYPYVKGGAEKRIYEVSRRLAARGYDVHVFGMKWWEGPWIFRKDGVTYHGVCKPRALYVKGRRSILEAIWFGICLIRPLLRESYDVIDCNEHPYFSLFSCKIACMLKEKKLFATWHEVWGSYWNEYLGIAGFAGRLIEWTAARMPDQIIAVSERTAADIRTLGVRPGRIKVIPNGILLEHIRSIPASCEASDVIFVGRLIKDKHVDILLQACTGLPVKLMVIGDGPERKSLEKLAAELEVNVIFAGFLPEEELIARLKASSVFVLPSTREGFGITVVEAMACGLPVITVNTPRNYAKDLVADGMTGRVVALREESIHNAIAGLTSDEKLRVKMSVSCLKSVTRYDWETLVKQLENRFKS